MTQIGTLARHADRPERLAIVSLDGKPLLSFAYDDTREVAKVKIEEHGTYVLTDDDRVLAA